MLGFVYAAYLSKLPSGALLASKHWLGCQVIGCDEAFRLRGDYFALTSRISETDPRFKEPGFWKKFRDQNQTEIDPILKDMLESEISTQEMRSRDILLIELLAKSLNRDKDWGTEAAVVMQKARVDAQEKLLKIVQEHSPPPTPPANPGLSK